MKIIIVCYPRVGSRYLTKKLNTCINPHPDDQFYNEQYQNDIFNKKVNVFSTHDRNINYLYKNLNLKKTDVIIHLIANPYNSITSFFNAWPQKEYKNRSFFICYFFHIRRKLTNDLSPSTYRFGYGQFTITF